jgi:predicted membrane channel-forming protein YqfA (hemolysin III family)
MQNYKKPYTLSEEIASSVMHGVGLVMALAALSLMVVQGRRI